MDHLTDEQVAQVIDGGTDPAETRRWVRHVLGGCQRCQRKLGAFIPVLFGLEGAPELPDVEDNFYDAALERAIDAVLGSKEPVRSIRSGWAGVEALLQRSEEERFRNPQWMRRYALEAVSAARELDPDRYGPGPVADLQARTWADLANAHRVNESFEQAEECLEQAKALLAGGTGDPLLGARLLDLEASLRTDQRRLTDALQLLDRLLQVYQDLGEDQLAGRALISKGINVHYDDRAAEAVELLREGLARVDPIRDPKIVAIGQQALLDALATSGRFREAAPLFRQFGLRKAFEHETLNLLKVDWVEAKILAGLGRLRRAEWLLRRVWEGFQAKGLKYESAMVGMELSAVVLRLGRPGEVRMIARQVLNTLESLQVHREAVRAVLYLEEACRVERPELGVVLRIVDFLRRVKWRPQLRFAP
jgi:tetratricopeptide (TPR) repeat protein